MCLVLIENVTVMFLFENNISIFFSEIGVYNLKCKLYVFLIVILIL